MVWQIDIHVIACAKRMIFNIRLAGVKMKFLNLFHNYQYRILVAFQALMLFIAIKMGIFFMRFFHETFYFDVGWEANFPFEQKLEFWESPGKT